MASRLQILIVTCAVCIGVLGGYYGAHMLLPKPIREVRIGTFPYTIEIRGVIHAYDPELGVLTIDALNPYAPNVLLPIRATVNADTNIVYNPDRDDETEGVLKGYDERHVGTETLLPGKRVYAFFDRGRSEFTAASIRIFGREQ